ncbi:MAG: hypothetical protein OHK0011_19460 [Turneriella sp.]
MKEIIENAFDLVKEEVRKTYKIFPAVHEDQIDNVFDGGVTCAITCVSMLLQTFNLPQYGGAIECGPKEEDRILKDIRTNLSAYLKQGTKMGITQTEQALRTNFLFLKWYVKERYGVELVYSSCRKVQLNRVIDGIEAPFIMSTSRALTSFGHIILARGRAVTAAGLSVIANDPWGVYPYKKKGGGEEVIYPMTMFPTNGGDGQPATYHMLSMGSYPRK